MTESKLYYCRTEMGDKCIRVRACYPISVNSAQLHSKLVSDVENSHHWNGAIISRYANRTNGSRDSSEMIFYF